MMMAINTILLISLGLAAFLFGRAYKLRYIMIAVFVMALMFGRAVYMIRFELEYLSDVLFQAVLYAGISLITGFTISKTRKIITAVRNNLILSCIVAICILTVLILIPYFKTDDDIRDFNDYPRYDKFSAIGDFSQSLLDRYRKGFNRESLYSRSFADYNVIRIYRLPSFKPEELLEIMMIDSECHAVFLSPDNGTLWEDMYVFETDSTGKRIGGRVQSAYEYKPSLTITSHNDTGSSDVSELYKKLVDYGIDAMRSVERQVRTDKFKVFQVDGTRYVVECKIDGKINAFDFNADNYDDRRYNDIMQEFQKYRKKHEAVQSQSNQF